MSPVNPRYRTLRSRFVALIAASGVVLGLLAASAVPSRAEGNAEGNKNLMKFLLGVAAVALIANELKKDDDDESDEPEVVLIPNPDKGRAKPIPAACAIEFDLGSEDHVGYSGTCLKPYGFRGLPRDCAVEMRIFGRPDLLYPATCLTDAGFRLGR